MRIHIVAILNLSVLVSCGPAARPGNKAQPTEIEAAKGARTCAERRQRVHNLVALSHQQRCESDAMCVAVMGPESAEADFDVIVHRDDSVAIKADAVAVRNACGAPGRADPSSGYQEVSPRCIENHCMAERTSVAPLELD